VVIPFDTAAYEIKVDPTDSVLSLAERLSPAARHPGAQSVRTSDRGRPQGVAGCLWAQPKSPNHPSVETAGGNRVADQVPQIALTGHEAHQRDRPFDILRLDQL
jgi:hypothetical protein